MTDSFAHIHVHSDFSCLDGYGTVQEYAEKVYNNNMKYLCITDHGMGAAYPRMLEESERLNLTPIFGCEVYVNNFHHLIPEFSSLSEEEKRRTRKNYHLVLLAKNNIGYQNLVKIISESWINGFYYKPRITKEKLIKYSEGLICSTACLGSELSQLILHNKFKEALDLARQYKEIWPDDYYIELQMIKMDEQDEVNSRLIKIADKLSIPLVLTNDVHYCEEKDAENHRIQLLVNSKGTNNKPGSFEFHTQELWFKTVDELNELWKQQYKDNIPESEFKEAKINTIRICEKCHVEIDTSPKFPKVDNAKEVMLKKCIAEMKRRNIYQKKEYQERLLKEYSLICDKGFESYFLVIEDIINWAKSQEYSVGPGRGSGAGSLICYLLGITQIDPVKHELLFERFLSPSRGGFYAQLQFSEESEIK